MPTLKINVPADLPASQKAEIRREFERIAEVGFKNAKWVEVPENEETLRLAQRAGYPAARLPLTQTERAAQEIQILQRAFAERAELLKDCLTTAQTAKLLGLRRQAIHERYKRGALLALPKQGDLRFPAWQFDPHSDDGVLPGLLPTLRALEQNGVSVFGQMRWFVKPNPAFDGTTPSAALRAGKAHCVLEAAQTLQIGQ